MSPSWSMSHLDPFDNAEVLPLASRRTGDPPELPPLDLMGEFVAGGDDAKTGPKAGQAPGKGEDPSVGHGDLHRRAPLKLKAIS